MNRERELLVVEQLRAALACVYGGMPLEALEHAEIARRELQLHKQGQRVELGLTELRRATDMADDFDRGGRS